MAVPFKSRGRKNPRNRNAAERFYPAAAYIDEIDINNIAEDIAQSTALTQAEVIGVLRSFLQTVPHYMLMGYKVRLDSLGIFKIGLKTRAGGRENAEDVSANDIIGIRVLYTPDMMIKQKLANPRFIRIDIRFAPQKEPQPDEADETAEPVTEEAGQ